MRESAATRQLLARSRLPRCAQIEQPRDLSAIILPVIRSCLGAVLYGLSLANHRISRGARASMQSREIEIVDLPHKSSARHTLRMYFIYSLHRPKVNRVESYRLPLAADPQSSSARLPTLLCFPLCTSHTFLSSLL